MANQVQIGLVLQGGGALGAYELGAARRLYRDAEFQPSLIAGVSIGAITAVLLARPALNMTPLQALEAFWKKVTVSGSLFPPNLREYASVFGNPNFFMPRLDLLSLFNWTNIYDTGPLRQTLSELVDLAALADPTATPQLLVSATDIEAGQIAYFDSEDGGLGLDHILASGSLPPSFAMTKIGENTYWDGGLFDNTPLGKVINNLKPSGEAERAVYVVNLFPNKAPIPANMAQVFERMSNLQFANKTASDVKLMERFNPVAALMQVLATLPPDNPVFSNPLFNAAYAELKQAGYVTVPHIIQITRPKQVEGYGASDFSPETIQARAAEGSEQTEAALQLYKKDHGRDPPGIRL